MSLFSNELHQTGRIQHNMSLFSNEWHLTERVQHRDWELFAKRDMRRLNASKLRFQFLSSRLQTLSCSKDEEHVSVHGPSMCQEKVARIGNSWPLQLRICKFAHKPFQRSCERNSQSNNSRKCSNESCEREESNGVLKKSR